MRRYHINYGRAALTQLQLEQFFLVENELPAAKFSFYGVGCDVNIA